MRVVFAVVLFTASCGAAAVRPTTLHGEVVDGLAFHAVRRFPGSEAWAYDVFDGTNAWTQACVDEERATGRWECSATIPRAALLHVVASPVSPGDWFVDWTTLVPSDATGVDLLLEVRPSDTGHDWRVELVFDRPLEGVVLDLVGRRLVNGSPHTLVPARFASELASHLEALGPAGWQRVPLIWQICGVPGATMPISPGGESTLDATSIGRPAVDGEAPDGPFRVVTEIAVLVEPGGPRELRRTERYTVSAPLERLEDYVSLEGPE